MRMIETKRINVTDYMGNILTLSVPFVEIQRKWGKMVKPHPIAYDILNQFKAWELRENSIV